MQSLLGWTSAELPRAPRENVLFVPWVLLPLIVCLYKLQVVLLCKLKTTMSGSSYPILFLLSSLRTVPGILHLFRNLTCFLARLWRCLVPWWLGLLRAVTLCANAPTSWIIILWRYLFCRWLGLLWTGLCETLTFHYKCIINWHFYSIILAHALLQHIIISHFRLLIETSTFVQDIIKLLLLVELLTATWLKYLLPSGLLFHASL